MDCEKFDSHVIDELYDELDEVTHAAMKRHMESCARCSGVLSGLRATREVGVLPLVEPSDDLEDRILEAAAAAQRKVPWQRKAMRAIAWAGSHAMRPQLAMAAVFMLIIGSSLLLLRAKPGSPGAAPVRITEHGEPVPESPELAAQAEAEPAPAATALAVPPSERSGQGEAEGAKKEAKARADDATLDGADKDQPAGASAGASTALSEARAVRSKSGCGAAVSKFDDVGVRFPGTAPAADAMWEAAACYKSMGNADKARELYLALRGNSSYKDRADAEIALADSQQQQNAYAPGGGSGNSAAGAQKAAAAAAPAPAAPAKPKVAAAPADNASPPAASPPAATGSPGGTGKAPASPTRKQESGL